MATVTSKTSIKIDDLINDTVVSGQVSANGHLLLITRGGAVIDAGSVVDPGGSSSIGAYTHVQGTASAVWSITHPLPFRPNVSIVDSTGTVVEGDIKHNSSTSITVTFSAAFSGSAYLS